MTVAALHHAFPDAWVRVDDDQVGRMDNAPRIATSWLPPWPLTST